MYIHSLLHMCSIDLFLCGSMDPSIHPSIQSFPNSFIHPSIHSFNLLFHIHLFRDINFSVHLFMHFYFTLQPWSIYAKCLLHAWHFRGCERKRKIQALLLPSENQGEKTGLQGTIKQRRNG